MAGERIAKITIRASWSRDEGTRADQTEQVRLRLGGTWQTYRRGAEAFLDRFIVPDPNDADGGQHTYVLNGVTNLLALVRNTIQQRNLPYVVSEPRDLGDDLLVRQPVVEFDINCTVYDAQYDLAFDVLYQGVPSGWRVTATDTTLVPVLVSAFPYPAGVYESATGGFTVFVTQSNGNPCTIAWADNLSLPPDTFTRSNLKRGSYKALVTDVRGVNASIVVVVGSDPRLDVLVNTTQTSVELVVSGGLKPYAYAWADGPTTATRDNLTPGTYTCTVTDARGATRTVTAVLAAYRYYWSQNPVALPLDAGDAYRLDPTTKPNLSFLCEVWLEKEYLSGVFELVGPVQEQPADAYGRTVFDVQALLDPYLAEHLPPLGPYVALRADSLFRRFYLRQAEKFGTPPLAVPVTAGQQHYVVLGGLSDEEAVAGTWFQGYQAGAQPFLTWEPDGQRVLPAQPAYLYYMHAHPTETAFRVLRRARFVDGSTQQAELVAVADVRRFEVFCLQVGPGALGLTAPNVAGYDVWVVSAGGAPLSEVRHFQLDHDYYPQQRFFHYTNSLGGVNVLAAFGNASLGLEVTATEATRTGPADPLLGDTLVLDRAGAPTLAVATGPRRRAQLYADQELLLSRRVTLYSGGRYWAGRVKPATFVISDESAGVATLAFEYVLSKQRLFTPRLPVAAAGQVVAPVAGGEGVRP